MVILRALAGLVLGLAIFAGLMYSLVLGNFSQRLEDPEVYNVAISETDAYNRIYDEVLLDDVLEDELADLLGDMDFQGHGDADPVEVLRGVMPPAYLQEQTEANIARFTAYLRHETDDLQVYVDLSEPLERIEPVVYQEVDRIVDQLEFQDIQELGCSEATRAQLSAEYAEMLDRVSRGTLPESVSPLPGLAMVCYEGGPDDWIDDVLVSPVINSRAARLLSDARESLREPLAAIQQSLADLLEPIRPLIDAARSLLSPITSRIQGVAQDALSAAAQGVEQASRATLKQLARPLIQPRIDAAVADIRLQLKPGDRLDLLEKLAENSDDFTRDDIRQQAESLRDTVSTANGPGRIIALLMVIIGSILLAVVYIPRPADMLRWPGITLFLGSGVCLVVGVVINSAVPGRIKDAIVHSTSYAPDVPTAAIDLAGDLLESFAQQSTAGFIPAAATVMAIGVVLVVASFFASALWAILRGVLPGSGGNSRRR